MDYGEKILRRHERYPKQVKADITFNYDFNVQMDIDRGVASGQHSEEKISAVSKNISAEGLCFTSQRLLKKGDKVQLDMYLSDWMPAIHMEGEVCWSEKIASGMPEQAQLYDTGIHLIAVDGKEVEETVYFDQEYQVFWSHALETVLGNYRKLMFAQKVA